MVTPDGASSTIKDEGNHERRSLAAAAIRRGNIKISEPITWVEGVPDASSQLQFVSNIVPPEQAEEEREEGQIHGFAVSTDEHTLGVSGDAPQLHHRVESQYTRETVLSQARSTPIDPRLEQRDSTIAASPASQDQMQTKKKRRSGTIRTVFRKVFGRREKNQLKQSSPPQSRAGPKHEYTRSDPFPNTTGKSQNEQNNDEPRNYQIYQTDPLRSQPADDYVLHSPVTAPVLPFPMNVNAPEPHPSQSNYLSFESGPHIHRRRATLPSMILSDADAAALRKMWSTPDLQLVSPSIQSVGINLPSPVIGMAVTSGSNPNRRSRSAGALRELSRMQDEKTALRRRSSEIRFWRTSRIAQLENDRRVSNSSEYPSEKSSTVPSIQPPMTEVSDALAETGSSVHEDNVHAFDFGSMSTEQNSTDKHISVVETRLSQLEFNMQHLSMSLQEVTKKNNRQTIILSSAPRQRRSQLSLNGGPVGLPASPENPVFPLQRSASSPRFTQQRFEHPLSSPSSTPIASPGYLSSPSSLDPASPTALTHDSVQSARLAKSQATPHSPQAAIPEQGVPLVYDHLAPLYNALRYERETRKALELQVLELRRDVLELGKVVTHLRGTQGYPTPSPDQAVRAETVAAEKSRFSGYDSDEEEKGVVHEKWATPMEENAPRMWRRPSGGEIF